VSMVATPYQAEDILQALLETHPDLLAGGQMTPEAPRRWALVKREQGVPDRDSSGSRWSVDHLFVDQDAMPTLVEVKRSTDTRIRREVVGQMLDYAANGVRYWPVETLKLAYETTQRELGNHPAESLAALCENRDVSVSEFFARVGDNLRAGRIRMVFVADVIPDELMRIVEFLNEQMSPAEVYAVQVKQYRAEGHGGTVIVPAVYGRTAAASTKSTPRRSVDRATALAASKPATLFAIQFLEDLAEDVGLVVHETPSGALLKTPGRGSVANVYLVGWDSVEVPLEPLRVRGWTEAADEAYAALSRLTAKGLTLKNPTMPTEDAVANWDRLRPVLVTIANLYLSTE
jgi:hypothetical protein